MDKSDKFRAEIDNSALIRWIEVALSREGIRKQRFFEETGVSSATYSQWNTNTFRPTKRKLSSVADFFGVPVEALLSLATQGENLDSCPSGESQGLSTESVLSVVKHREHPFDSHENEKPTPEGELDDTTVKLIDLANGMSDSERLVMLDLAKSIIARRENKDENG